MRMPLRQRAGAIAEAVRRLESGSVGVEDIAIARPTLDDVFIALTGRAAEHEDGRDDEEAAMTAAVADSLVLAGRNLKRITRAPDLRWPSPSSRSCSCCCSSTCSAARSRRRA